MSKLDKFNEIYLKKIIFEQSMDLSTQSILNSLGFDACGVRLWSKQYGKCKTFINYDEDGWHIWIDIGDNVQEELVKEECVTLIDALKSAIKYINDTNTSKLSNQDEVNKDLFNAEQLVEKDFKRGLMFV